MNTEHHQIPSREAAWQRAINLNILGAANHANAIPVFADPRSPDSALTDDHYIPGDLVLLLIDASASMLDDDWKPTRLDAGKQAILAYITRLIRDQTDVHVAVVAYGSRTEVVVPPIAVQEFKHLESELTPVESLGSTNIHAALTVANELAGRCVGSTETLLLSDGHNTGPDPRPVADVLRQTSTIETVGIAGTPDSVDTELMKYIATPDTHGRKRYRWIGEQTQLVRHFRESAGRLKRS